MPEATKKLQSEGVLQPGSLKQARQAAHYFRFEPLKHCSALEFSLNHGAGLSLNTYLPAAAPPRQRNMHDLVQKPCAIFLCDQESKQTLGIIKPG